MRHALHPCQRVLMVFLVLCLLPGAVGAVEPVKVVSPDGKVAVTLSLQEKLTPYPEGTRLYYAVTYDGRPVLVDSPFGLAFKDMPPLAAGLRIVKTRTQQINQTWERVVGKSKKVLDSCNELQADLEETNPPQRQLSFVVRAYNDGVAFRYVLPEQQAFSDFKLTEERSEFHFRANHRLWAANYFGQQAETHLQHIKNTQTRLRPSDWPASYSGFYSHQEAPFVEQFIHMLSPREVYGCPILLEVEKDLWVALTEASLVDWAGLYFSQAGASRHALVTALSPRVDEPDVLVKSKAPRRSPWRVLLIGTKPGDLIESDLIDTLNEACALKDVSWIQPGKSAWDRWWCGDYLPDAGFQVGMNNETMQYFIDFAAEMSWEYQLVDWTWYGKPFYPGTWISDPKRDITRSIPEIDIPRLVQYAKSKGVKLLVWLDWEHCSRQMDEAFPLYEKWGVAGVKIDFMQRDDQDMVNWYHKTVKKAAEHHLVVDFHGAYKPTGWSRTYPNLLTREGVMGNEYNKWSSNITPDHCLTLPFTRGMLGAMDFTPGGFRHKTKDTFRPVGGDVPGPFVMGTRCFQLAMMVVYESPLQVLCDSPYNYRISPAGLDFLKIVPTTWDQTKVINGQVGDFITVARRRGDTWYVGSMTDWDARTLEIPLGFLGSGQYEAQVWRDAYDANEYPDRLLKETRTVTAKDTLTAKMASAGGHVMVLRPAK